MNETPSVDREEREAETGKLHLVDLAKISKHRIPLTIEIAPSTSIKPAQAVFLRYTFETLGVL